MSREKCLYRCRETCVYFEQVEHFERNINFVNFMPE